MTAPVTTSVEGWGMAVGGQAQMLQPTSAEAIAAAVQHARSKGLKIALRGSGCSYGDASCGTGKLVLDFTRFNQILDFDKQTGVIRAQAGATIGDVWQHVLPHGWWPPVVSGTMAPTLGGAVAMNIHGKNAYRVGPIGDHVLRLRVLLVDGTERDVLPDDPLFAAVIGGFGELAIILEVEIQLKHIYSGLMDVDALSGNNLAEIFQIFDDWQDRSDYLVAWIDGFAGGSGLGRGLVHIAHQLKPGEDPQPKALLSVAAQTLPSRLFGVIPKSWMWVFLWPFANNLGWRLVCWAKFWSGRLLEHGKRYRQGHAAFHFLLDYVPNFKFAYKPGGLIQHQIFLPKANAQRVFAEVFEIQQRHGLPTWLAVMKRHRPDRFLLTHGLDGYSMAQDFAVTKRNRHKLWQMCHEVDAIVTAAGGRFYFAKDATLQPDSVLAAWPHENLRAFAALRQQLDPEGILATDLYDRAVLPALQKLG